MEPVRELPYGPAASMAAAKAGQMSAPDYAPTVQKPSCFPGASTDDPTHQISEEVIAGELHYSERIPRNFYDNEKTACM